MPSDTIERTTSPFQTAGPSNPLEIMPNLTGNTNPNPANPRNTRLTSYLRPSDPGSLKKLAFILDILYLLGSGGAITAFVLAILDHTSNLGKIFTIAAFVISASHAIALALLYLAKKFRDSMVDFGFADVGGVGAIALEGEDEALDSSAEKRAGKTPMATGRFPSSSSSPITFLTTLDYLLTSIHTSDLPALAQTWGISSMVFVSFAWTLAFVFCLPTIRWFWFPAYIQLGTTTLAMVAYSKIVKVAVKARVRRAAAQEGLVLQ